MHAACRENSSRKRRETIRERNEMGGSGARIEKNARFISEWKYLGGRLCRRGNKTHAQLLQISKRCSSYGNPVNVIRWKHVNKKYKTQKYIKATENARVLFNIKQSFRVKDRWKRGSSFLRSLRSPRKREFARRGNRVGKSKVEREICSTANR